MSEQKERWEEDQECQDSLVLVFRIFLMGLVETVSVEGLSQVGGAAVAVTLTVL